MRSARKGWWSPSPAPMTMGSSPGKGGAASGAARHLVKEGNVIENMENACGVTQTPARPVCRAKPHLSLHSRQTKDLSC